MKNEFVPYDIALAMKELGFDEGCFGYYYVGAEGSIGLSHQIEGKGFQIWTNSLLKTLDPNTNNIAAPLYQQSFRWFREKYGLNPRKHIFIVNQMGFKTYKPHMDNKPLNEDDFWNGYDTYEEAQDVCLRKLIEIVKEKQR